MSQVPARRPGDRIIRRRFRASQTITLPVPAERPGVPNVRRHAKLFVGGLLGVVLVAALLLSLPWMTRSGEATPFVEALFIAVSAATVTGLVTVDTHDHWNFAGQLIILVLIQLGGLGFMVGASLVLRMLQRGATGLRETLLLQDGAPTLSLREAALLSVRIVRFTFIIEAIGAIILSIRFAFDEPLHVAIWHGIFHSISAFCNAGFDLQGDFRSLVGYQQSVVVSVTVMVLIQLGALSYVFFADLASHRGWRALRLETKIIFAMNVLLLAIAAAIFLGAEWNGTLEDVPVLYRPLVALFQSVSARTAGFATVDFAAVTNIVLFSWIAVMFVGGAPGSTSGGVKLTTVGVVALAVFSTVRGLMEPQVFGRRIPTALIFRAMAVITIMFLFHFAATLALTVAEHLSGGGESFITLLFETMSAVATVGLSAGVTPEISTAGKLILIVTMIFGRLGPLTAVYALQVRQHVVRYRYPEAPVRIG